MKQIPIRKMHFMFLCLGLYVFAVFYLGYNFLSPRLFVDVPLKPANCYLHSLNENDTTLYNVTPNIDCKAAAGWANESITVSNVVFMFRLQQALPLEEYRWLSTVQGFLTFNTDGELKDIKDKNLEVSMISHLAYNQKGKEMIVTDESTQTRRLRCDRGLARDAVNTTGMIYGCNYIPVLYLSSENLQDYHLSIRFPVLSEKDYLHHKTHFKNLMLKIVYTSPDFLTLKAHLKVIQFSLLLFSTHSLFLNLREKPMLGLESLLLMHAYVACIWSFPVEFLPEKMLSYVSTLEDTALQLYDLFLYLSWIFFCARFVKNIPTDNKWYSYFYYIQCYILLFRCFLVFMDYLMKEYVFQFL